MQTIGIIAGSGALPRVIIEECHKQGIKVSVCALQGHTDEETLDMADISEAFPLGQFGKMIKFFHNQNIDKVCFAGAINKPNILDIRPDFLAAKMLFSLKNKGDDALLRGIIDILEKEKLYVVSVAQLVPSLLAPIGVLSKTQPDEYLKDTLEYARPIFQGLGAFDIGQSLVVKDNIIVAVECLEGTDATIKRGGELGKKGDKPLVLIKMLKKGQDERADLPTIGLKTFENLIENNYKALILHANKTLFFDREKSIELANKHNFTIWSIEE